MPTPATEQKHSPLPWRTVGAAILSADGKQVASTYPRDGDNNPIRSLETDDANQALMIQAVNSHAALVSILQDVGQWLEAGLSRGQISRATVNRDGDLVSQIRSALATLNK